MSAPPRLGTLAALAALGFAPSALAGAPPPPKADLPIELSFETERTAEGLLLKMYARNTGNITVKVDDNPYVRSAAVRGADGSLTELEVMDTMEMMSRAGPRRVWMPVRPGERVFVGTATLLTAETAPVGGLELSVGVVTVEATKVVTQTVQLAQPGA